MLRAPPGVNSYVSRALFRPKYSALARWLKAGGLRLPKLLRRINGTRAKGRIWTSFSCRAVCFWCRSHTTNVRV